MNSGTLMKALVLLSLLLSSAAFAQFPPEIASVTPQFGPTSGRTTITIRGQHLIHETCVLIECTPPRVFVGAMEAQILSASAEEVVVSTPSHSAGRFNVTLFRNIDQVRGIVEDAFTYRMVLERVLVPIVYAQDIPGAYGSLWRTELAGFNGSLPNFILPDPEQTCAFPDVRCPWYVGANSLFVPQVPTDGHVPGRLLYLAGPGDPRRVQLNVRVRDVSRESESHGTELPVVLENDAFGPSEVIGLPNVPLGPLYRQKLRIYDLEGARRRRLEIRIDSPGRQPIQVLLRTSIESSGDFPLYPGYAELDLDTLPGLAGATVADVLIGTPFEGRFWAFISVTNNVTQQITTITP